MSQLIVASATESYSLNVTSFSTGVFEEFTPSAQTKTVAVHYPIKVTQPDITFDVVFANEVNFENFQRFVRNHQQTVINNPQLLTLMWPQRGITNWTGVIPEFQSGGMRFNPAPHARFKVLLVDSLVSSRTDIASVALSWTSIYGGIGMPDGVLNEASLTPQQALEQTVGNVVGGAALGAVTSTTAAPAVNAIPIGTGILAGTGV